MEDNNNTPNGTSNVQYTALNADQMREYLFEVLERLREANKSNVSLENIPLEIDTIKSITTERPQRQIQNEYGRTRAGALSVGIN